MGLLLLPLLHAFNSVPQLHTTPEFCLLRCIAPPMATPLWIAKPARRRCRHATLHSAAPTQLTDVASCGRCGVLPAVWSANMLSQFCGSRKPVCRSTCYNSMTGYQATRRTCHMAAHTFGSSCQLCMHAKNCEHRNVARGMTSQEQDTHRVAHAHGFSASQLTAGALVYRALRTPKAKVHTR